MHGIRRRCTAGIREAYDLGWHSNGGLYAGVNVNDPHDRSPAATACSSANVSDPHRGDASREGGEWVLLPQE